MAWIYDSVTVGMTTTFTLRADAGSTGIQNAAGMMRFMFNDTDSGTLTGAWSIRSGTPRIDGTGGTVTRSGATITIVSTSAATGSPAAGNTISILSWNGDVGSAIGGDIRNGVTFGNGVTLPSTTQWILAANYTRNGTSFTLQTEEQARGFATFVGTTPVTAIFFGDPVTQGTWINPMGATVSFSGATVTFSRAGTNANSIDAAAGQPLTLIQGDPPLSTVGSPGNTNNGVAFGASLDGSLTEWEVTAATATTMTFRTAEQANGFATYTQNDPDATQNGFSGFNISAGTLVSYGTGVNPPLITVTGVNDNVVTFTNGFTSGGAFPTVAVPTGGAALSNLSVDARGARNDSSPDGNNARHQQNVAPNLGPTTRNGITFGASTSVVPDFSSRTQWVLAADIAAQDSASIDVTLQSSAQARGLATFLSAGPNEQSELWFRSMTTSAFAIHHNGGSSAGNFFGVSVNGAVLTLTPNGASTLGLDNGVTTGDAVTATRGQPSLNLITSGTRGGVAFGTGVFADITTGVLSNGNQTLTLTFDADPGALGDSTSAYAISGGGDPTVTAVAGTGTERVLTLSAAATDNVMVSFASGTTITTTGHADLNNWRLSAAYDPGGVDGGTVVATFESAAQVRAMSVFFAEASTNERISINFEQTRGHGGSFTNINNFNRGTGVYVRPYAFAGNTITGIGNSGNSIAQAGARVRSYNANGFVEIPLNGGGVTRNGVVAGSSIVADLTAAALSGGNATITFTFDQDPGAVGDAPGAYNVAGLTFVRRPTALTREFTLATAATANIMVSFASGTTVTTTGFASLTSWNLMSSTGGTGTSADPATVVFASEAQARGWMIWNGGNGTTHTISDPAHIPGLGYGDALTFCGPPNPPSHPGGSSTAGRHVWRWSGADTTVTYTRVGATVNITLGAARTITAMPLSGSTGSGAYFGASPPFDLQGSSNGGNDTQNCRSGTQNGITFGASLVADITAAALSNGNQTLTVTFDRDPGTVADTAGNYSITGGGAPTVTAVSGTGTTRVLTLSAAATANVMVTFAGGTTITSTGFASTTAWRLAPTGAESFRFTNIISGTVSFESPEQLRGMLAYFAGFNMGSAHQIKRIAGPLENPNSGGYQVNNDNFLTFDTDAGTVTGRLTRANVFPYVNEPTEPFELTYALVGGASGSASGTTVVQSTGGTRNGLAWGASVIADISTAELSNSNETLTLTFDSDPGSVADFLGSYNLAGGATISIIDGSGPTRTLTISGATSNFNVQFASGTAVMTTGFSDLSDWRSANDIPNARQTTATVTFQSPEQLRALLTFAGFDGTEAFDNSTIILQMNFGSTLGPNLQLDRTQQAADIAAGRLVGTIFRGGSNTHGNDNARVVTMLAVEPGRRLETGNNPFGPPRLVRNGVVWGSSTAPVLTAAALEGTPNNMIRFTFQAGTLAAGGGNTISEYTVPNGVTLTAPTTQLTGDQRVFNYAFDDSLVTANFGVTFAGTTVTTTGFSANQDPIIAVPDVEVIPSGETQADFNARNITLMASDADGDPLTFSLQSSPMGAPSISVSSSGVVTLNDDTIGIVRSATTYTYTVAVTDGTVTVTDPLVLEIAAAGSGYTLDPSGTPAVFYGNDAEQLCMDIATWSQQFPAGTPIAWAGVVYAAPMTCSGSTLITGTPIAGLSNRRAGLNNHPGSVFLSQRNLDAQNQPIALSREEAVQSFGEALGAQAFFAVLPDEDTEVGARMNGRTGQVLFSSGNLLLDVIPAVTRDYPTDNDDFGTFVAPMGDLDFSPDNNWYIDVYSIPQDIYVRPVIGTFGSTVHEFDFELTNLASNTSLGVGDDYVWLRDTIGNTASEVIRRDTASVAYTGTPSLMNGMIQYDRDYNTDSDSYGTFDFPGAGDFDGQPVSFTTTGSIVGTSTVQTTGSTWDIDGTFNRFPEVVTPTLMEYTQRLISIFDAIGPREFIPSATVGMRNRRLGSGIGTFATAAAGVASPATNFGSFSDAGFADFNASAFLYHFDQSLDFLYFNEAERLSYTHSPAISTLAVSGAEARSAETGRRAYGGILYSSDESLGSSGRIFQTFVLAENIMPRVATQAVRDAFYEAVNGEVGRNTDINPDVVTVSDLLTDNTFTMTPRRFGLDSSFTIEVMTNNSGDLARFNELLADTTVQKIGAITSGTVEIPRSPTPYSFEINDDLEGDNRLSAVRPWPRSEVNFNLEYPVFAQGNRTLGQVAAADITYANTDGTPYESYVERIQLALSPEFDTEQLASLALWTDGFAREFTDQAAISNRLEVRAVGTNYPGEMINLSTTGGNVHPISEGYKVDLRVQGRFMNIRITDQVTDPTEDPTNIDRELFTRLAGTTYNVDDYGMLNNSYSQNTAWRLSGMQADIMAQGTR